MKPTHTTNEVIQKASKVKLIVLDNDGVFTDGRVYVTNIGTESKAYDIRDGFGVVMARRLGIQFAIITGLLTPIVEYRAKQLGIEELRHGFMNKLDQMKEIIAKFELDPQQVAYMGDDIFDLPVMRYVGLGAAPADAYPLVKEGADWVSDCPGGHGAVRELIDLIVKARGEWDWVLSTFIGE